MHLENVRSRIAAAAARAGRDPAEVSIVAVTKSHPMAAVREALAAGLVDMGENRVQEAFAKQAEWPDAPVRWHLIGHLQRNKAKQVAGRFALIHSVDSIRLADALEQAAEAQGLTQDVLVQVNVAREPQKGGVLPEEAEALIAHTASRPHLALRGLMAMAPFTEEASVVRATFRGLRVLREAMHAHFRIGAPVPPSSGDPVGVAGAPGKEPILSMGMSSDFEVAVEEGATLVRLGTILFGERAP